MAQLNDLKLAKLRDELLVAGGQIDDLELIYLQNLGAVSQQVNDAWLQVFAADLGVAASGQFNDDASAWLALKGYPDGSLNEQWFAYWEGL